MDINNLVQTVQFLATNIEDGKCVYGTEEDYSEMVKLTALADENNNVALALEKLQPDNSWRKIGFSIINGQLTLDDGITETDIVGILPELEAVKGKFLEIRGKRER